jgi:hypothetical protein
MRELTEIQIEKLKNKGVSLYELAQGRFGWKILYSQSDKVFYVYYDTQDDEKYYYLESVEQLKGFLIGAFTFQNGIKVANNEHRINII